MARQKFSESIEIPEGIICTFESEVLKCKKDNMEVERRIDIPFLELKIKENSVTLISSSANKVQIKKIRTLFAHLANMFRGLNQKFVYHLGVASVHFPMTLKIEGSNLFITNFL